MTKNYQTQTAAEANGVEAVLPDVVSITLAELAGSLREGSLALAVGAGFPVIGAIIDENVTAVAARKATRPGRDSGASRHRGRLNGAGRPRGAGPPDPGCAPSTGPQR